jgi:hypothetical protein
MLEMLAWIALLLGGSATQAASRPKAPVATQTQATQQQKQTNATGTGGFRITGRVVNSMTGAPVAGAYVAVNEASGSNLSRTVRAGTDGSFVFTQIPAGRYVLRARRKGYVEQMYLQHERFTTAILAGPNLNTENLVFPLSPEGVISGEVTDEAGEPVQSAKMLLFREDTEDGRHMKRFQAEEATDEEGRYRFGSLPRGHYYLAVSAEPWYAEYARSSSTWFGTAPEAQQEPETQNGNLDLVYPITYYPNATEASSAAAIRMEAGGSAQADLRLVPVAALRLRVEVGNVDEQAPPQILVTQTILGTYQDEVRASRGLTIGRGPFEAGGNGDTESLGPATLEVDGLRPGPSVVQVTTTRRRDASQSNEVTKSVRVDPTDGQTVDVRGIAPRGVVS